MLDKYISTKNLRQIQTKICFSFLLSLTRGRHKYKYKKNTNITYNLNTNMNQKPWYKYYSGGWCTWPTPLKYAESKFKYTEA